MQFGRALEWVLRKVATADPTQGPLYLLKIDLLDGFYHVCLHVQDAPMLGVAFPMAPGEPLSQPFCWCCLWGGQKVLHTSAQPQKQ